MANYKSAKKRILVLERNRQRNGMVKSKVKTALKKAYLALSSGDKENLPQLTQRAVVELDRAYNKGILHRNNVARHKSRLSKRVNEAAQ